MLVLSRILSKDIPQIRVDWYSIDDRLYFGELTFYDGDGFEPFDNHEDDLMMGEWIDRFAQLELLSKKKNEHNRFH